MKKNLIKLLSFKLIIGICIISIFSKQDAIAGTTWVKELSSHIEYGTYIKVGVEVLGVEVPIGFTMEYGADPIGVMTKCTWAIATCDNGQTGFEALPC